MKRSGAVRAFLIVSAAGAVAGCGQRHEAVRRCVDENGNVADNGNCTSPPAGTSHHYTSVYAPAGGGGPAAGEDAAHGATVRGVVGAEGAAHAGGGGGEGAGE